MFILGVLGRAITKRSSLNPLGNTNLAAVAHANCMVSRTAAVMLLAAARGIDSMLEQPRTSLMADHPRLRAVAHKVGWLDPPVATYMGEFG